MKIVVLAGAGEVSKRNELLRIKKSFSPDLISVVDLKQQTSHDLSNQLAAQSLFDVGEKLVVVENVTDKFSLEDLTKSHQDVTLVLVSGELSAASVLVKSAKGTQAKIITFEGDKEVSAFAYLDYLIEGRKEAFLELDRLMESYGGMYILSMIYYLLRRNLLPLPAAGFLQRKIAAQKKKFVKGDWEKMYELSLQAESKIKQGLLTQELALTDLTRSFMGV